MGGVRACVGWGAGRMGDSVRARGLGLLPRHVPHRLKGSRNPETSTEHAAEAVPRLYKRRTEVDCTWEGGMEGAVAPPLSPIPFHVTCPPETHLSIPAAQATEHYHSMPRKKATGQWQPFGHSSHTASHTTIRIATPNPTGWGLLLQHAP